MSRRKIDLVGKRFGLLKVIREKGKRGDHRAWLCLCDCGKTRIVTTGNLRRGRTRSCGCDYKTRIIDIQGKRFGRLLVIGRARNLKVNGHTYARWECQCDCGEVVTVRAASLRYGNTQSCGCYQSARASEARRTHGMSRTRLYGIWRAMISRCSNPNVVNYHNYGGRGIAVCRQWQNSGNFIRWALSHGYQSGLMIERRNNDRGYKPSNCYWATRKQQARNKRSNTFLKMGGKRLTIVEWSELLGIPPGTITARLAKGWDTKRILTNKDFGRGRVFEWNGR